MKYRSFQLKCYNEAARFGITAMLRSFSVDLDLLFRMCIFGIMTVIAPMLTWCMPSTSLSGSMAICTARGSIPGGSGLCTSMPVTSDRLFNSAILPSSWASDDPTGRFKISMSMPTSAAACCWLRTYTAAAGFAPISSETRRTARSPNASRASRRRSRRRLAIFLPSKSWAGADYVSGCGYAERYRRCTLHPTVRHEHRRPKTSPADSGDQAPDDRKCGHILSEPHFSRRVKRAGERRLVVGWGVVVGCVCKDAFSRCG